MDSIRLTASCRMLPIAAASRCSGCKGGLASGGAGTAGGRGMGGRASGADTAAPAPGGPEKGRSPSGPWPGGHCPACGQAAAWLGCRKGGRPGCCWLGCRKGGRPGCCWMAKGGGVGVRERPAAAAVPGGKSCPAGGGVAALAAWVGPLRGSRGMAGWRAEGGWDRGEGPRPGPAAASGGGWAQGDGDPDLAGGSRGGPEAATACSATACSARTRVRGRGACCWGGPGGRCCMQCMTMSASHAGGRLPAIFSSMPVVSRDSWTRHKMLRA